ncbi:ATP-dependent Clp protease ATP-binding subunit [Skermania sp. ID1734]|uniref:Clp protease N-terminal domain-containing protein n=1 Tax=Skermania sp. ID1734 TaxID=2597516 RepID=UPI00117DD1FF|nr:Clp protease N-terminal domain-containing protein [Skermania sp. ID1734]TSE01242.1 ATP-dependent Clp protease ATP-binding subunit [Skermania sp. ID1734]
MLEKFSDNSRTVIARASDEARRLGNDQIGTEHVLLALLDPAAGEVGQFLAACNVTADGVRAQLAGHVLGGSPAGELTFSAAARALLERSLAEARRYGAKQIRTEHLLLGLVGDDSCGAAQIITSAAGLDPEALRMRIRRVIRNRYLAERARAAQIAAGYIAVKLDADQRERCQAAASAAGLSIEEWIKQVALAAASS